MTSRERVFAAAGGRAVDRVPYALWQHSTVHERTVERFTRFTLDFHDKYRPDLLKVMYDEQYDLPVDRHHLREVQDWRLLEEFEAHTGAFGRQLECLARIRAAVGPEVAVVQTIYSPFHVAHKFAGRRLLEDWRQDPEAVGGALAVIAANYRRFAECCLREAGVDGFFFAPIGCEASFMEESQYVRMVRPSDLAVLEALRQAPLLILHIHGERQVMFDLLCRLPLRRAELGGPGGRALPRRGAPAQPPLPDGRHRPPGRAPKHGRGDRAPGAGGHGPGGRTPTGASSWLRAAPSRRARRRPTCGRWPVAVQQA